MKNIIRHSVRFYQRFISQTGFLSYFFGPSRCIYSTSCSEFLFNSVGDRGVFLGIFLTIKRIFLCSAYSLWK